MKGSTVRLTSMKRCTRSLATLPLMRLVICAWAELMRSNRFSISAVQYSGNLAPVPGFQLDLFGAHFLIAPA